MRSFELAFLLVTLPFLLWPLLPVRRAPDWIALLAPIAALLTVIHLEKEGYRWQMLPGYLLVLLVSALAIRIRLRQARLPRWASLNGIVLFAAALAAGTMLPVFSFPPLTGRFPVGTVTLHMVDTSRAETFSSNPQDRRELMVQLWYPAQRLPGAQAARYRSSGTLPLEKAQLALVCTHSVPNAPVASGGERFPVLIFSPSLQGGREQNTFEVEELASHGFVVAGMDHPYGTFATQFPDGRLVRTRLTGFLDYSSDEALQKSIRLLDQQVRIRALDALFVLEQLRGLDARDPSGQFRGRLDTRRAGIFGHSFGGAVAAEACWLGPGFRAGLDMDGMMFGEVADAGIPRLFLVMSEGGPRTVATNPAGRRAARAVELDEERFHRSLERYGGYFMTIHGTRHMNFADSPLYTPIKRLTGAGPIDPRRAMQIINAYTLAFFEQYLNKAPAPLLEGSSPKYPEVELEVHRMVTEGRKD